MSTPYPWIKDSQFSSPTVPGYLEVLSPNGIYLTDGSTSNVKIGKDRIIVETSPANLIILDNGVVTATHFLTSSSSIFSSLTQTHLRIANVPSNIVTITDSQISVGPLADHTKITPTNVTSTTFITSVPPAGPDELGNKTYIDNNGGTGGWYYTTSVSVSSTATSTVFSFPNCLNNTYNAYEVYFVTAFVAPTAVGIYPSIDMTFSGATGTISYQAFTLTQTTGGSLTTSYSTAATGPRIYSGLDFSNILNRYQTIKLNLWGTRNPSGGSSGSRFDYVHEGFYAQNPGISGWLRHSGSVTHSFGTPTGITLTFSAALTGTITIVVKSKY